MQRIKFHFKFYFLALAVLSFLLIVKTLHADDVMSFIEIGESASIVPSQARAESLTSALEKGTLEAIQQTIGTARAEKSAAVIKSRILNDSSKYVQFYKATEPVMKDGKTTLDVTMKISMTALREILDREGLLIQNDDVYTILPVIKIIERKRGVSRNYAWWKDDDTHATPVIKDQFKPLISQWHVQEAKGYKIFDPSNGKLFPLVSDQFKHENLSQEEALLLAQSFKASIVVTGEVFVTSGEKPGKTKAIAKLLGFNVANGRQILEFSKTYDMMTSKTNGDVALQQIMRAAFTDLAHVIYAQLQDSYKKGEFGSQTVKLMVSGDLGYQDLETVKKEIITRIPEIRALRERSLQRGVMALEGDLVGTVGQMVKKIEASRFENFELGVVNVTSNQVDLTWKKIARRAK